MQRPDSSLKLTSTINKYYHSRTLQSDNELCNNGLKFSFICKLFDNNYSKDNQQFDTFFRRILTQKFLQKFVQNEFILIYFPCTKQRSKNTREVQKQWFSRFLLRDQEVVPIRNLKTSIFGLQSKYIHHQIEMYIFYANREWI